MGRILKVAAICTVTSVMVSGCLLKDTQETWHVDASGGVTWLVTEKDVRSDANTLADRQAEENEYWLAVQQQRHAMAMGLEELGGAKLRTLALRSECPYTVQTEARFTGLDAIGRKLLAAAGALGDSVVTREGDILEWTLTVRDPQTAGGLSEPSENVTALISELNGLKVVLMAGRFESAQGFSLSSDHRVAEFDEDYADKQKEEPVITIKLRWKTTVTAQ